MKIEDHPTHARNSRYIVFFSVIIAVASWGTGFYIYEKFQDQLLLEVFVTIFMLSVGLFLISITGRAYICKCPRCKTLLFKQQRVDDEDSRKFVCKRCNTIWDTKVKLSVGGS